MIWISVKRKSVRKSVLVGAKKLEYAIVVKLDIREVIAL
jgi:hypothetical protein